MEEVLEGNLGGSQESPSGTRNYAEDLALAKKAVEFVKDLHSRLKKKRKPEKKKRQDLSHFASS